MADLNSENFPSRNSLKRPRPVVSCLNCRVKKLKCDRNLPCQQCVRAKRQDSCSFQPGQEPDTRIDPSDETGAKRSRLSSSSRVNGVQDENYSASSFVSRPRPENPTALGLFEQLEQRVARLENVVGTGPPRAAPRREQRSDLSFPHRAPASSHLRQSMPLDVFPNASTFLKTWQSTEGVLDPRGTKIAAELGQLYKSLKHFHRPPDHLQALNQTSHSRLLHLIPPQPTCRLLIELYFDNLEHCFRILHRPTFDLQLDQFFAGIQSNEHRDFIPQLIAVLAVSSILGIHRECIQVASAFNGELIETSVKHIRRHLDSLTSKELRTISALQTRMLLLLLRWMRLDKLSDLWELSGQIQRQALTMGMASDPSEIYPPLSLLDAEIRRRLWMTVCEQDMMLSILCNLPCLIPDFSCRMPLNVNDDELENHTDPPSRPFDVWTDSLCQCYLAETITQRLHGCRDMHCASRDSYDHVLEHSRNLERCLQELPAPLRFNHDGDTTSKAPARLMARMELDITLRRPLMQLYSPFSYANDESDMFSEARAGFLQSCLMVTAYQDLFDPKYSDMDIERPEGYWDLFYNLYRHEINQSVLGMCLEIQRLSSSSQPNQPVANHSFSAFKMPTYTKSSLLHSVMDTFEPMTRRISHLGSNLKDLAYLTIVFSSVRSHVYDLNIIEEALEDLAASSKTQLGRDGVPIVASTNDNTSDIWSPTFDHDAGWMTLPQLPPNFDDVGDMGIGFNAI